MLYGFRVPGFSMGGVRGKIILCLGGACSFPVGKQVNQHVLVWDTPGGAVDSLTVLGSLGLMLLFLHYLANVPEKRELFASAVCWDTFAGVLPAGGAAQGHWRLKFCSTLVHRTRHPLGRAAGCSSGVRWSEPCAMGKVVFPLTAGGMTACPGVMGW